MTALIDARSLPAGTVLTPDLAIIGGGPAGISLALALAGSKLSVVLLESGGMSFDPQIQKMYSGAEQGVRYTPLDAGRLRFLGGSTNHWGGWCRPLDEIDFQQRDWMPHSGWPISRKTLEPYYPRAQSLVEAGPWLYDGADTLMAAQAPLMPLGQGGLYTSWFQFSKTRDSVLPTYFGHRYEQDLAAAKNVTPYTYANITGIRLTPNGQMVDHLDVATLASQGGVGNRFTVKPRQVVLACGGMENARLL
ncbi:MAG TPA: FAD-dependent oxidoreductase, partial [Rhizomicrobium sp.]